MQEPMQAKAEHAIIKKYRPDLWRPFIRALQAYHLVENGDHIAVAISGGKDSLLLAKLLQELQRHGQTKFDLSYIAMDPGFNQENRNGLLANTASLGIDLKLYSNNLFQSVEKMAADNPCYLCARMRRGFLYEKAQNLGANKLALGHHLDDVVETIMINLLYAGNFMTMMPILSSQNFQGLKLIRPMYYIEEEAIIKWAKYIGLSAMDCGCAVAAGKLSSKRAEVKAMIKEMKKTNPNVAKSILKASQNVHLDAILGFKRRGKDYFFADYYEDEHFI